MQHVMFDIDGTLIQSYEFDGRCFADAVREVTGHELAIDWTIYPNATDRGILMTLIELALPHWSLDALEAAVKMVFLRRVTEHLAAQPAEPVDGAIAFFNALKQSKEYTLSIATGGWRESALLKLASAGFDVSDLVIGTSNDHHERIEIMKTALRGADPKNQWPVTYFGDAQWDIDACETMQINLVIVGSRVTYRQQMRDFIDQAKALAFIDKSG
ncbi:HAD family hydrolase [Thaumasiovibrio subtropicus]|uniref:HAD family hydrolase n=1 Tax=Thaumasiovibrio subtropicus TaxID=1891207 RepID=UPI000B35DB67|nr:HAD hydrolase-like protein [Thaumasiovibrio subtropicus]